MDKETIIITWLVAMIAPIMLYGIWMQIKMMKTDEGMQFLIDRGTAKRQAGRSNNHHIGGFAQTHGKIAKLGVGLKALDGKYGDDVSAMIKTSFKVFGAWVVYLAVIGPLGYFLIF